jgi:hypothetical protein
VISVRSTLLVLLPLALLASAAQGTVLADWDVSELAARADRIDVVTVVAQRSSDEGELGRTFSRVRVERTLKGAKATELELTQLGGVDTEVVGDARLRVGERWLLFSFGAPDGRRYLVGMSLGAWRVDGARLTQDIEVPLASGDGELLPAPGRRAATILDVERALLSSPQKAAP